MFFFKILAVALTFSNGLVLGNPAPNGQKLESRDIGTQLSAANHYGSPIPPWEAGAKPGWYYGKSPSLLDLLGLGGLPVLDGLLCLIIDILPGCLHCPHPPSHPKPPPSDGWTQVFSNLTGAIEADDFLTFGMTDDVEGCKQMCENVGPCFFINAYHDVNGKDGSPLLTCSLYANCHTAAEATNLGGQSQPDGSIDFIRQSDGFCFTGTG
ncbi:hypothetical protein C8J56DRAFT_964525 [Mycena floridula]|nr:hypothetical protein C8J56DRAFT_964525 [Mycena floridula]